MTRRKLTDREMTQPNGWVDPCPDHPNGPLDRQPQPFDRFIDPALVGAPESSEREVAKLRAELAACRDAAIEKFGPLTESPLPSAYERPSWDEYFSNLADAVALRGDCRRRQVGCVIVDTDHRVVSTGYNGAEPGGPSCLAGECPRGLSVPVGTQGGEDYSNCIACHAELNAIIYARGVDCKGATIYVTRAPCDGCSKAIRAAGIARVVHP